jgi:demethylmenaquinone methyltransferase/2-methoxy-6-polyprenyl-1,4-benzoquinol methylase
MPGRENQETIWGWGRLLDPHGQPDKAARVRAMFDAIAPTYERVNTVLSAGFDARWRRRAARLAGTSGGDRVLDLACGTGDFARAFAKAGAAGVVGCDFAEAMLQLAAERLPAARGVTARHTPRSDPPGIRWCGGDALCLPFKDGVFSLVGCAFGVRNFQDLALGMEEVYRVLTPGGRAVILEFSRPRPGLLAGVYSMYLHRLLPWLATLISGDRSGAYRYLSRSVATFADPRTMVESLREAGFSRIEYHMQTIGIVAVYIAWKQA